MTGVIDVGGGLRGIYGAGIFDRCLKEQIQFDYCAGVSAGSANVASYLGGQAGRNYRFYHDYAARKEYMSMHNFVRGGSYIDLSYVYSILSDESGEDPLNYAGICENPARMVVVSTDAETGAPIYFGKEDMAQNHYEILSASSAIPAVCAPQRIAGKLCFDGGVADPVPVEKALRDGCEKIVLILTKPLDVLKPAAVDRAGARVISRRYPRVARQMQKRFDVYMRGVHAAQALSAQGKCLILAPNDCCGVKTLTRDKGKLNLLYQKGYADASAVAEFLK